VLVSPVPIWWVFTGGTAYLLSLILRAVKFYFVLPLLILAASQLRQDRSLRTPAIMFVFFTGFGLLAALSTPSLEGRHLALMVIYCLPLQRCRIFVYRERGTAVIDSRAPHVHSWFSSTWRG
jgi:Na+/glutamate symporter